MIRTITIHLNIIQKQILGTLAIKDRTIYFEYDKSFLKKACSSLPTNYRSNQGYFAAMMMPLKNSGGCLPTRCPMGGAVADGSASDAFGDQSA